MAVKLSRKCKRKTRNKQTKRGKTMKGGARGLRPGHSGSVRISHGNRSRRPSIPGAQPPGTRITTEYAHMFKKTNQPKIILNTTPAFTSSRTGQPVYVPRVNTKSSV